MKHSAFKGLLSLFKLNSKNIELMVVAPLTPGAVGEASPYLGWLLHLPTPNSTLTFQSHIMSITRSAFYHLENISRVQSSLFDSVAETLIQTFNHLPHGFFSCLGVPRKALDRALTHVKPC